MPATTMRWPTCAALLATSLAMAQTPPEADMNAFACSLYRQLAGQEENLFFSPFSVSTALAMTAEGARGETARQMAQVLGLDPSSPRDDPQQPLDWSPLHAGLGQLAERLAPRPASPPLLARVDALRAELDQANAMLQRATVFDQAHHALGEKAQALADELNRLQKQIDPTEFHAANALWVERSFALETPYLETIARHYRTGGVKPVDFRRDPEAGRTIINDWVGAQTNQRIEDLLAPRTVDATTRLVLTNAVYFLGEWLEPFDPARTRREKFFLRNGSSIEVPLMRARKTENVRYAAFNADGSAFATPAQIEVGDGNTAGRYPVDGVQVVELPYRGDALSMLVILPMNADGLASIEPKLSADALARWSAALESRSVDVALPTFRLETGFELSQPLQQLGMRRAFVNPVDTERGAQFDGISAGSDPAERLYIGAVVHKAFVQVDEKGTEAAAATAVAMLAGSALPAKVDFTPVFRADRAFLFLIRDRLSGTVLFLGRVIRPERR